MLSRVKRSRSLRLLVAVWLAVPLVLMATQTANAAGGVSAAQIKVTVAMPQAHDIRCGLVHLVDGADWKVQAGGWCQQTTPPEWGDPALADMTFEVRVTGLSGVGSSTTNTVQLPVSEVDDGWIGNTVKFGGAGDEVGAGWQALEVCVIITSTDGRDRSGQGCIPTSIGSEGEVAVECSLGTLQVPKIGQPLAQYEDFYSQWYSGVQFDFTPVAESGTWVAYAVVGPPGVASDGQPLGNATRRVPFADFGQSWTWGQASALASGLSVSIDSHEIDRGGIPVSIDLHVRRSAAYRKAWGEGPHEPQGAVIGVGIGRWIKGNRNQSRMIGGQHEGAIVGVNDPDRCNFYWGEKLWDDGAPGGTDDPAGPAPHDPGDNPEEGPEPPEVEQPLPPDGDPWWMGLFDLVRKLISAVTSLPGKIADAFGALFVPRPGFVSGKIDGLSEDLGDSGPGQYVSAVQRLVPSGAADGCAGPTLNLDVMGQSQQMQPLNACDGPRATLASASTVLIGVSSVLFGGLACVRAIGSGFGWRPGVAE